MPGLRNFPNVRVYLSDDPESARDIATALKYDAILLNRFFANRLEQWEKELLYLYEFNLLEIPAVQAFVSGNAWSALPPNCSKSVPKGQNLEQGQFEINTSALSQFPEAKRFIDQLSSSAPQTWCQLTPGELPPVSENINVNSLYTAVMQIKRKILKALDLLTQYAGSSPLTAPMYSWTIGYRSAKFLALSLLYPEKAFKVADAYVKAWAFMGPPEQRSGYAADIVTSRADWYNKAINALGRAGVLDIKKFPAPEPGPSLGYVKNSASAYLGPDLAPIIETFIELYRYSQITLLLPSSKPPWEAKTYYGSNAKAYALVNNLNALHAILPLFTTHSLNILVVLHTLYSALLQAEESYRERPYLASKRTLKEQAIIVANSMGWNEALIPIFEQSGNPALLGRASTLKRGNIIGKLMLNHARRVFGNLFVVPKIICDSAELVDQKMKEFGFSPAARSTFIGDIPCGTEWNPNPYLPQGSSSGSQSGGSQSSGSQSSGSQSGGSQSGGSSQPSPSTTVIFQDWAWCVSRFPNDPDRQLQCFEDLQKKPTQDVTTPAAVGAGFGLGTFLLIGALAFGGYWAYTKWLKPRGAGTGGEG